MKPSKKLKPIVAALTCPSCARCVKREFTPSPLQTRSDGATYQAPCKCGAIIGALKTARAFAVLQPPAKRAIVPSDLPASGKEPSAKKLPARATGSVGQPAKDEGAKDPLAKRWLAGERISELAAEAGVRRSVVRRRIQKAVGGKERFRELRAQGAGGTTEPFGGKRPEPRAVSDEKVKRIKAGAIKWKAGTRRLISGKKYEDVNTIIHPKTGEEYVSAGASERADLIVESRTPGLPDGRYRLYRTSSAGRRTERERELIAQGIKQRQAKRAAKRAKKLARKGGKGR